jgi:hypothetical protein
VHANRVIEIYPSSRAFRVAVSRRSRDAVSHAVTLNSDLSILVMVTELKTNKQEPVEKTLVIY